MDKIIFSGNVGKQPEFQSKDGKDYCRFTVAKRPQNGAT